MMMIIIIVMFIICNPICADSGFEHVVYTDSGCVNVIIACVIPLYAEFCYVMVIVYVISQVKILII